MSTPPPPNSPYLTALTTILKEAVKINASDVHLKAEQQPYVRVHGRLQPLDLILPKISKTELQQIALTIMDEHHRSQFAHKKEIDIGLGITGLGRFRVNIFQQRGTVRMVIRIISFAVPNLAQLGLPEGIERIADHERGLILVCGATGSGKSSTLAAIVDLINRTKQKHIITLEDPIEYLIHDQKCIISQREIGIDTDSFPAALRSALRQDPDIILIGEIRDKETMDIVLTAAETGHLVLSTLHTIDAQETINRILSMYEPHQQTQIRVQFSGVLRAIISQRLAKRKDGRGLFPVVELLVNTKRIQDLIVDPTKTSLIRSVIEDGKIGRRMQSFDQCLIDLINSGIITYDEALLHTQNPEDFALKYSGIIGLPHQPPQKTDRKNDSTVNNPSRPSKSQENMAIELDEETFRSKMALKKKTGP